MKTDYAICNGTHYTSAEWLHEMATMETENVTDQDYLQASTAPVAPPPGPRPPPTIAELDPDDCCADARWSQLVARMAGVDADEITVGEQA